MVFSEKLIELRKTKGWSQENLGYELNVTRQTVSKWELGQTTPEMEKLIEISNLFNVSIDELVGKEASSNSKAKVTKHYEYKSKKTLFGLPLIHINIGNKMYKAKGIIAIGNIATGVLSLGMIAVGLLAIGGISLGIFAVAGIAAGLLAISGIGIGGFVVSGIALGIVAIGGISVGILSIGGMAFGVYTIGGVSCALNIAIGGIASGYIAVGESAQGVITFLTDSSHSLRSIDNEELRNVIIQTFPNTSNFIVNLFTAF